MAVQTLPRRLLVALGLLLAFLPQVAAAADPDFPVTNGWFYAEAGGGGGLGYAVTNEGGVGFWRDYQRLGGPGTLGYPASWRFVGADGFIYQTAQGALLQWRPEDDRAALANTFDMLSSAGRDDWLRVAKGIPAPISDDGSQGDFGRAVAIRLAWLEDDAIRRYYFANPNPGEIATWTQQNAIELYGLPTSKPQRMGPFLIQRFQRVALQKWLDAVPGMPPPGSVVRVLGGDMLKEAGLVPSPAAAAAAAGSVRARVDAELAGDLETLGAASAGRPLRDTFLSSPISLVWAPLPSDVGALFSARRRWVAVNIRWHDADPKAIATLLGHELTHVRDFLTGQPIWTTDGCFRTEQDAFKNQAAVWSAYYPNGKSPEQTELDRQLNYVFFAIRRDPDAFAARVVQAYQGECGDISS